MRTFHWLTLAALVSFWAGCSLLVDVDAVRAARDAGAGGGAVGGGQATGGGAQGGGAPGGGMAGGEGGGAVTVYDGGISCAGLRPRLRCDAPQVLESTGVFRGAALSQMRDGLVAGYLTASGVHVRLLPPDGGVVSLADEAVVGAASLDVAAEGEDWAAAWNTGSATAIQCVSNADTTPVTLSSPSTSDSFGVAVAAGGAVAIAAADPTNDRYLHYAISTTGCPSALGLVTGETDVTYVRATHLPGTWVEGMRFTKSGQAVACSGSVAIFAPTADGGVSSVYTGVSQQCPKDHSSAVSSDGGLLLMTYLAETASGSATLVTRPLRTDIGGTSPTSLQIGPDATSWSSAPCGAGCSAVAWVPTGTLLRHAAVNFVSDDLFLNHRSASDTWDVACNVPDTASIALAWHGGRLGVLLVEPSRVRLFRCDVPPL